MIPRGENEKIVITRSRDSLAKLGATARWLLEKAGIQPEGSDTLVCIGVRNENEKDKLIARMQYEFDARVMTRLQQSTSVMQIHGVWFSVVVAQPNPDLTEPRLTLK